MLLLASTVTGFVSSFLNIFSYSKLWKSNHVEAALGKGKKVTNDETLNFDVESGMQIQPSNEKNDVSFPISLKDENVSNLDVISEYQGNVHTQQTSSSTSSMTPHVVPIQSEDTPPVGDIHNTNETLVSSNDDGHAGSLDDNTHQVNDDHGTVSSTIPPHMHSESEKPVDNHISTEEEEEGGNEDMALVSTTKEETDDSTSDTKFNVDVPHSKDLNHDGTESFLLKQDNGTKSEARDDDSLSNNLRTDEQELDHKKSIQFLIDTVPRMLGDFDSDKNLIQVENNSQDNDDDTQEMPVSIDNVLTSNQTTNPKQEQSEMVLPNVSRKPPQDNLKMVDEFVANNSYRESAAPSQQQSSHIDSWAGPRIEVNAGSTKVPSLDEIPHESNPQDTVEAGKPNVARVIQADTNLDMNSSIEQVVTIVNDDTLVQNEKDVPISLPSDYSYQIEEPRTDNPKNEKSLSMYDINPEVIDHSVPTEDLLLHGPQTHAPTNMKSEIKEPKALHKESKESKSIEQSLCLENLERSNATEKVTIQQTNLWTNLGMQTILRRRKVSHPEVTSNSLDDFEANNLEDKLRSKAKNKGKSTTILYILLAVSAIGVLATVVYTLMLNGSKGIIVDEALQFNSEL